MSTLSEEARSKAKSKAERLVRADPRQRVDASGYMPEGAMNADVQTGPRVISRRQYASGGGVAGGAAPQRADRKPRASGGAALTPDSLANTNVKEANQERDGIKHDGGMKSGGRTGKMAGGALSPQQRMALGQRATIPALNRPVMRAAGGKVPQSETGKPVKTAKPLLRKKESRGTNDDAERAFGPNYRSMGDETLKKYGFERASGGRIHASGCECSKCGGGRVGRARGGPAINEGTRPIGGRLARKAGGRTKKGTTVNINIIQPPAKPPMPPMGMRPPGAPPPGGPIGMAQGMPPQGAMMPPPGAAGIPPAAPLMPRAAGGRTYPIETGSGGGRARLDKAARAARA